MAEQPVPVQSTRGARTSSIKEALAGWGEVAALLRGGDQGALVPVVIPRDSRGTRWLVLVWLGVWALASAVFLMGGGYGGLGSAALWLGVALVLLAALWWWRY